MNNVILIKVAKISTDTNGNIGGVIGSYIHPAPPTQMVATILSAALTWTGGPAACFESSTGSFDSSVCGCWSNSCNCRVRKLKQNRLGAHRPAAATVQSDITRHWTSVMDESKTDAVEIVIGLGVIATTTFGIKGGHMEDCTSVTHMDWRI